MNTLNILNSLPNKLKSYKLQANSGFLLVEAILSVALFALLVTALSGAYLYGEESTMLAGNRQRAIALAEEGLEAVRNIRDANFSNLVDGTYGLATSGNQWSLSGSSDTNGIFTRSVTISPIDPDRKNITSNITWQQNSVRAGSVLLSSRLSFWQKVIAWANPNTLMGSVNLSGTNAGRKIQVSGNYAYLVRAGGTPDFAIIDISTPASPVLLGSLTLTGTPYDIYVSGAYAYVVGDSNTQELQVINIANPLSPSVVGTFDVPGAGNGQGIYVVGNTAYVARETSGGNTFAIINVAVPSAPTLLGSLNTGQVENEVVVSGNYAYLASGSNTQELRVVSISNPASPTTVGSLNLSGNTNAIAIALLDTKVFVGRGSFLYAIDVSTPTTPVSLGSYDAGGTVNDISIGGVNNYAFLATLNIPSELQIVDTSTPSALALIGVYNALTMANGVAYDAISDKAYVVGASNPEFYIIAP